MEHKIFENLPQHHEVKGIESPLVIGSVFDKLKNLGEKVVEEVKEVVHKVVPTKQEKPPEKQVLPMKGPEVVPPPPKKPVVEVKEKTTEPSPAPKVEDKKEESK